MRVFRCFGRQIAAEDVDEVRAHVSLPRRGPLTDLPRFDVEPVQKPSQLAWREGLALGVVSPRPIREGGQVAEDRGRGQLGGGGGLRSLRWKGAGEEAVSR